MEGLPKWIQIKNGFLKPRTKQDNSRSKLNTQNPPGWQEDAAPAQKKNVRKTMDPSITGECGGLEGWFISKIMLIIHLKLLFCHLKKWKILKIVVERKIYSRYYIFESS